MLASHGRQWFILSDTAEFAVESIRFWWKEMGRSFYAKSREILITADGGGSNGYRVKLWKLELQTVGSGSSCPVPGVAGP